MSNRKELLTPVGRLVQGSLYNGSTTSMAGEPLVYKTGAKTGQPRTNYFFALAIQKGTESHWSETAWGQILWLVAHTAFPNGQTKKSDFSWKVVDGDGRQPNKNDRIPAEQEGFPGHWVLKFSSSFAPKIYNEDGTQQLMEPDHVKPGDYVQVYGTVEDNNSTQTAGIFLQAQMVAFAGYGDRIAAGADPKSVGFGQAPLPPGASKVPKAAGFNPAPSQPPVVPPATAPAYIAPTAYAPPPTSAVPIQPYTPILNMPAAPPPPPAPVVHRLTEKAQGATYEQLIAAGWSHDSLIQHGVLLP